MRVPAIAAISLLGLATVFGAGPSFRPDGRFSGSTLTGWHLLGNAQWRAQNGEIVGVPNDAAGGGGWLLLDRSFQDVGVYASFRVANSGKAGVLLRAESTPRTARNPKAPGGAEFVPELIHNRSGAGSDLLASDLNGDGRLDIVTATRFGTFIFWGRK